MKRFFGDIKKYFGYMMYATKSDLKSEVATSHLNWMWWILDPILFMFIYGFVVQIVFKTREESFAVFILIGLTVWTFFNKGIKMSVRIVQRNKNTISKVYIPKFILILVKMFNATFKFFISSALIVIVMAIIHVPYTPLLFNYFPILIVLFVFVFGCTTILCHFGVFVPDIGNVLNAALRMLFYLSGVFFSVLERVPSPYGEILGYANPIAYLMNEFRNITIYQQMPNYALLGIWLAVGIVLSIIGISMIYKYENSYVKVL